MAKERARFRLWAAAALAAGFLLRLAFVMHHPPFEGDALIYGAIARNLLLHGIYGFNEQVSRSGSVTILPTLIRLPGYPLFLAACFRLFGIERYTAVLYVQLVADLGTCLLAAATARRLFGPRAALAALWVAALCPFTANYVATPLTETLVLTTIALAFYAMLRWQSAGAGYNHWLWLLAAALSESLLLRPEQGLLAAAVLPLLVWAERAARSVPSHRTPLLQWLAAAGPAIAAAVCLALPLLPWTIRNLRTFHIVQPLAPRSAADPGETPPTGFNLWYKTWGVEFASTDQVYWNANGGTINPEYLPDRAFALSCSAPRDVPRQSLPLYAPTVSLIEQYNQTTEDSPQLDARFAELARQRRRAAPLCTAILIPAARLMDMLLRPRIELFRIPDVWWKSPAPPRQTAFALAYALLGLAYVVVSVAGLLRTRRIAHHAPHIRPVLYAMLAMVLLRAALLLTLDNSEPRYTLEFFPVFFVWIGALAAQLSPEPAAVATPRPHVLDPKPYPAR